jgi:hypothetical protein
MAHGHRQRTNGLDIRDHGEPLTCAFWFGAGDGNRIRTISSGSYTVRACHMA